MALSRCAVYVGWRIPPPCWPDVWVANSPVASPTDSRLLFWEILLPNSGEAQRAAESLLRAGYPPLRESNGLLFQDPWGITVALRVAGASD
jgi:hypothetical protein